MRAGKRNTNSFLKGTLFESWGGSARAHLSLTSRKEESYLADDTGTVSTQSIIDDVADIANRIFEQDLARKTNSITAEINVPLVSSANPKPGIARLDATLSARYDDIESLGGRVDTLRTTYRPSYSREVLSEGEPFTLQDDNVSWSTGLVWRPVEWLAIRGNVNESFTTPPMAAYVLPTNRDISQDCWLRDEHGGPAPCQSIIYVTGGNPELLPEHNRTRSIGLEIRPNAIPDLFLAVNLHFNRLVDRIGELNGPNIRTVADLTPERADLSIDDETGIIAQDRRVRNLGRVKISGADLNISYRLDTPIGMLDARLDYGYLHENTWRQVDSCGENSLSCFDSTDDDPINRVATIPFIETEGRTQVASYLPVPRHRANLRVGWERAGWRVDASWSYASSMLKETKRYDAVIRSLVDTTSFTKPAKPVDLVVSYDFDKANRAPDLLRGTRLRLSVPNVFQDETEYVFTPQLASDTLAYFDPIHSRPRGRTYTLSIHKRFDIM